MKKQKKMKGEYIKNETLAIKDIALVGIMVAALEVGKVALSMLPNIEIVTFLIILYTLYFGRKSIYAVFVFVIIEFFIWGLGIWTIMYLYIWPLLYFMVRIFKKNRSVWFWSIFSSFFGLIFGGLCSLVYLCIGSYEMIFSWWIAGLPWDIIHAVSNFFIMFLLYHPVGKVFQMAKK